MKIIKNIKATLIIFTYLVVFVACNDDAPTPNNEITDKGHGEWYKIEFRFTEGHLHFHHDKDHHSEASFFHGLPYFGMYPKTVQSYVLKRTHEGVVASNDKIIHLVKGRVYGLEITYYGKNDNIMSGEFTTPEMAPIHQHFFITNPGKSTLKQKEKNTIDYIYRDTEPFDKMFGDTGVRLRAENDPIGLKGYFTILEDAASKFDLNVVLVHVVAGTKLDDKCNPYPFYAPSLRLIGTQDLNVKIPIHIFAKYPKTDTEMSDYIKAIATEFGISEEEARKEVENRKNLNPKSGKYKL